MLCHILIVGSQQDKEPITGKDCHAVKITKLMRMSKDDFSIFSRPALILKFFSGKMCLSPHLLFLWFYHFLKCQHSVQHFCTFLDDNKKEICANFHRHLNIKTRAILFWWKNISILLFTNRFHAKTHTNFLNMVRSIVFCKYTFYSFCFLRT